VLAAPPSFHYLLPPSTAATSAPSPRASYLNQPQVVAWEGNRLVINGGAAVFGLVLHGAVALVTPRWYPLARAAAALALAHGWTKLVYLLPEGSRGRVLHRYSHVLLAFSRFTQRRAIEARARPALVRVPPLLPVAAISYLFAAPWTVVNVCQEVLHSDWPLLRLRARRYRLQFWK
jgi:hypothetical protein